MLQIKSRAGQMFCPLLGILVQRGIKFPWIGVGVSLPELIVLIQLISPELIQCLRMPGSNSSQEVTGW